MDWRLWLNSGYVEMKPSRAALSITRIARPCGPAYKAEKGRQARVSRVANWGLSQQLPCLLPKSSEQRSRSYCYELYLLKIPGPQYRRGSRLPTLFIRASSEDPFLRIKYPQKLPTLLSCHICMLACGPACARLPAAASLSLRNTEQEETRTACRLRATCASI